MTMGFLIRIPYLILASLVITQIFYSSLLNNFNTFNLSTLLASFLISFLGLFIVLTTIYSLYYKAYINRYYYDCGPEFITIKKNVFTPTEIHVQYQKIQDVYVDQDIFDRMFGLYDVHIASATITSGIEAHIDGVNGDVAENIKNIILSKIKNVGNPSVNQQIQNQKEQQQSQQTSQFQSDKEISSKTYPISRLWIYSTILKSLVTSSIFAFFISMADYFGSKNEKGLVYNGINVGIILGVVVYGLVVFIFIFLLYFILSAIWKRNFYFEFMPDYVLLRTGIFSRTEKHMPYKSIQNITKNQGIFDRMLGLSDVIAQDATMITVGTGRNRHTEQDGVSMVWQPKEKADELVKILSDIVSKINPQNSNNNMGL
jgi:membrane protein YdbS with pleckstrin-like domain